MLDHFGHGTEGGGCFGTAGLEEISQLVGTPGTQAAVLAAQALGSPTINDGATEVFIRIGVRQRHFLEADATFRVAGATMPRAFDQVLTAGEYRVVRLGDEITLRSEQGLPVGQRPAASAS